MFDHLSAYPMLAEQVAGRGQDIEAVKAALKAQRIETPSWGYANSGTRFKVFPWPGAARTIYEKLQDAALVHRLTGITPKVDAMIASVMNCQTAYAKALLVDRAALTRAQAEGDVLGAHRILVDACETDVRPLLAQARVEMGRDPDPLAAFRAGGYAEKLARERGNQAGGGGYALA